MRYLVLLLLFVGCSDTKITMDGIVKVPKFKVGDCIDTIDDSEFEELRKHHYRQIIKVGKESYLYDYSSAFIRNLGHRLYNAQPIDIMDEYNEKVDCKTAGF